MGHYRLGNLPHTEKWKEVIGLLMQGADLSELANASFDASLTGLNRVASDPGFLKILNSIIELAAASRESDLKTSFYKAGVEEGSQTSSFAFISQIANNLSNQLDQIYPRSDVGKIAQDAILISLSRQIKGKTKSLFGDPENIKSLSESFRGNKFKLLMHDFYSGFMSKYLSYHLSREIPHHVGNNKRFGNLDDHTEFTNHLDLYCRQTVRITDDFTPGWVGKAIYEDKVGPEAVSRYAHVAFEKLISEFKRSA